MKKTASFAIALLLFTVTWIGFNIYSKNAVVRKSSELFYYNTDSRNSCKAALKEILKENSIPVFGSSELSAADDIAYPKSLFKNGNSDFNMVLMGRGYTQSLHHVISIGAAADILPDRKAVLILSPQWFTSSHLSQDGYADRFSERMYSEFLKNPHISYATKERVSERVKSLLTTDLQQLERVKKYEEVFIKHSLNPVVQLEMRLYDSFMNMRQRYLLGKEIKSLNTDNSQGVAAELIDYDSLMNEAQEEGEKACTNNDFYIYDEYYDTYIRDSKEDNKGAYKDMSYLTSPEYEDLRLFLDVCKETGIEPLIVSVPVNGRWYDWAGFPKEDREGYYENIKDICEEYKVELADFSDKEYEAYFLKDIMHLGWKGWVYLDEAVYQFYKE